MLAGRVVADDCRVIVVRSVRGELRRIIIWKFPGQEWNFIIIQQGIGVVLGDTCGTLGRRWSIVTTGALPHFLHKVKGMATMQCLVRYIIFALLIQGGG